MSRLANLELDDLTPEQRRVAEDIMKSRGGTGVRGPFGVWLRSPEFADRAQRVGDFCRYHTRLPQHIVEFAIIITAYHFKAQVEFYGHSRLAIEAGLPAETAEAVRVGKRPQFRDDTERAVYDLVMEYFEKHRVSDQHYQAALAQLGEEGLVELVGIIGYYAMVAASLNVFEVDLPEGVEPPFQ